MSDQSNAVSHPSHYTNGGIECKDAMKAAMGGANGLSAMAFIGGAALSSTYGVGATKTACRICASASSALIF